MKSLSNILWGLFLVAIGIIWGLNELEITNIDIFFSGWWTVFIIVPSFIGLFKEGNKIDSLVGILIGVLLLLACQEIINFDIVLDLIFPIIIVSIGLSLIFKNSINKKVHDKITEINNKNKEKNEFVVTFSGGKANYNKDEFKGCEISAIFGGFELDLRDSIIKDDVVINVTTIFGGVDIKTPKDVNIKTNSTSIFGGIDDKKVKENTGKHTIYINATCLFGGIDLK